MLVDDGSTDGSKEWVEQHYKSHPRVRFKHIMPNRGYTGGNNYGARMARGKYIVLLSNDSIVEKKWLGNLVEGMKNEKKTGIMGSFNLTEGHEKRLLDLLYKRHKSSTMNLYGESILIDVKDHDVNSDVLETFFVAGNGLCFRKEFCTVPFDESYFIYGEDVYVCWLARIQGWKVKQKLSSRIVHANAGSKHLSTYVNKVAVFNGAKNQILNFFLFYDARNVLRIFPLFALVQMTHLLYRPYLILTRLKVWYWILRNIPLIARKRRAIQKKRTVRDDSILKDMSCLYLSPESGFIKNGVQRVLVGTLNKLFKGYCWIFRIRTREFF